MGAYPTPQTAADVLARVRRLRPRVHCLMNTVVQKFTADGITVVGGIPSMTSSLEEIAAFAGKADALTVNLGTLDADDQLPGRKLSLLRHDGRWYAYLDRQRAGCGFLDR